MYYKIENKNCQVYRSLKRLRLKEKSYEILNEELIVRKSGSPFTQFVGKKGQGTFGRVTVFRGFKFTHPENLVPGTWVRPSDMPKGFYAPNSRTKLGREMAEFLRSGLKTSYYERPLRILGVSIKMGRFQFPFVEITNTGVIIVCLDDTHIPKVEGVVEISSEEFNDLLSKCNIEEEKTNL